MPLAVLDRHPGIGDIQIESVRVRVGFAVGDPPFIHRPPAGATPGFAIRRLELIVALAPENLLHGQSDDGSAGIVHVLNVKFLVDNHHRRGNVVQMAHQRIEGFVDPLNDLFVPALEFFDIPTSSELPFDRRLGQHAGFGDQFFQRLHDRLQAVRDNVLIRLGRDGRGKIPDGQFFKRARDVMLQTFGKGIHGLGHLADFILAVQIQPLVELAFDHVVKHFHGFAQGNGDVSDHDDDQDYYPQDDRGHGPKNQVKNSGKFAFHIVHVKAAADDPVPLRN